MALEEIQGLTMRYDFSHTLKNKNELFIEFIETHTSCVELNGNSNGSRVVKLYSKIFDKLMGEFASSELVEIFEELSSHRVSSERPYLIVSNEIYGLKNIIISNLRCDNMNEVLLSVLTLFKEINNKVAHVYLLNYVDKLISMNNVRRGSLADLLEKNLIKHYESHLIWLTDLAQHIKNQDKSLFPEMNDTMCDFGKWIHGDAKLSIQNNSKYKTIQSVHKNLHLFSKKIFNVLGKDEFHILITYLEKCEMISLGIGTELALLDQITMNQKVTKDALTGALNRNGFKDIFVNQYELSLATSNPFVLAMCDLDFFKQINDTHGHVGGDEMLKLFVDTVKKNIRNSDVIIRYGGEEFVIVLPSIDKVKGLEVLEKVRSSFKEARLDFDGGTISATVSIGMIEIRPELAFKKAFLDEYVMIADKRLYMAKESGRDRVEYA